MTYYTDCEECSHPQTVDLSIPTTVWVCEKCGCVQDIDLWYTDDEDDV